MSNLLNTKTTLSVGGKTYSYYSIPKAAEELKIDFAKLPFSLKVLLENLLRNLNGRTVTIEHIKAAGNILSGQTSDQEIAFSPARVLMQDFTGVPAVVDLAAMRDAMVALGGDPRKINPLSPVDLVIDHSVQVDSYGTTTAFKENVDLEMERNKERYEFLRWGQKAFDNFRVVPPGTGICHQVNLEYLAKVVWTKEEGGETIAFPDTLVGTDSHTTMVNGMAVLGWGVGGIEAEAAMLGQPITMLIPEVIGFKLIGSLREGTTATDLVLTVTEMLRKRGVVGKFVEFFGPGLAHLPLADRATIANMAPEYGATCGFFPVDEETLKYLELTGRDKEQIALVEAYAKANGMWGFADLPDPIFTDILELDLNAVESCLAGPKRPQDRVSLGKVNGSFAEALPTLVKSSLGIASRVKVEGEDFDLGNGDITIAAITSCTNTSNPSVMLAAGLLARNAVKKGLKVKPWVKTSIGPGSKVVTGYYKKAGLQEDLDKLGFNIIGYGCTTCIGNSGPLKETIENTIRDNDLAVVSVLSGNRNFEGRVHQLVKANYLASPLLVVAYAIAGNINIDLTTQPLGIGSDGKEVFLKDIWPTSKEIQDTISKAVTREMFISKYKDVFEGDEDWKKIKVSDSMTYPWKDDSTYIKNPPYFVGINAKERRANGGDIKNARILALLGDSITTDHISPAGNISGTSPAAKYLLDHAVTKADFNSYGARRGNHEVMMRGTFANIRIKNEILPGTEGGLTKFIPTNEVLSIYEASMKYQADHTPLVIFAGKEYGTGSSRDWAAKGTNLLGVKAVIAESFERIHRSNLVGMGILPLVFPEGTSRKTLELDGTEIVTLSGLENGIAPKMIVNCSITRANGTKVETKLICRIDTLDEIEYFKNGGILQHVMFELLKAA